jgi:hypothetical protein
MRQNVRQVGQDQPRSAAASSLINGAIELDATLLRSLFVTATAAGIQATTCNNSTANLFVEIPKP